MKIDYELSLEDAWAYSKGNRNSHILFKPYALLIGPALALILRVWSPSTISYYGVKGQMVHEIGDFWTEVIVNSIVFTGLILLFRYVNTKQIKSQLRNSYDEWGGPRTIQFTDDKIIAKSKDMYAEINPNYIKRVEEGLHHIFLVHSQASAWTIPKRFLPSGVDANAILGAVRSSQKR